MTKRDEFEDFVRSLLSDSEVVESVGHSILAQTSLAEYITSLANTVREQAETIGRLIGRVSALEKQSVAQRIG